ncbi:reverse transcriptase domain-containing protein [Vreelandella titanicae]|uniref:reverse transcriptase domain-containing protein n=1 Tax=Vreelandella titanicae TaxID=664683 RepID=UPI00315A01C9
MSTVSKDFALAFSFENLRSIYVNEVSNSRSTGVDNIDAFNFEKDINNQLKIIERKALAGTYSFTRYKQKLISKGAGSAPREICIPTIRDKIALKAINHFLQKRLSKRIQQPIPQDITKEIKKEIKENYYDWVIKLDISNFYPSIQHDLLRKRLRKFIKDETILDLIDSAIKQNTSKKGYNLSGVPQGLPISNILAALYLRNLDSRYANGTKNIYYRRYIDDILILCKKEDAKEIGDGLIKYCKSIRLKVYDPIERPDKSKASSISEEFSYLGYIFNPRSRPENTVTTRPSSKQRLIDSLTGIFTSYRHSKKKSTALLQWKLNLRITGCVSEKKGKGWIFFFSEIDDKRLLFELDSIVDSLCRRFSVNIKKKRFVRAWHEIKYNRWRNNYFPNFDRYNIQDMASVIATHRGIREEEIDMELETLVREFWNIINREIKDLETDIQGFS